MSEARFIEDLSVGAKRYWLVQPLDRYDYVIVAPEPSSGQTSVYAATDHGDIKDIVDDNGNPLVLARFEGEVAPAEALSRLGYEVETDLPEEGGDIAAEDDEAAA
jgi:hypothetical protein